MACFNRLKKVPQNFGRSEKIKQTQGKHLYPVNLIKWHLPKTYVKLLWSTACEGSSLV